MQGAAPNVTVLRVLSNSDLDRIAAQKQEAERAAQATQNSPVVTALAAYVRKCWEPAQRSKMEIERRMLKAKRQRNGQYEPEKLQQIAATGGSAIFMQITEVKCRAAESWIRDILLDAGEPPWELQPSPIPNLSPDLQAAVQQEFTSLLLDFLTKTGVAPDMDQLPSMQEMHEQDFRQRLLQTAQEKADRMSDKIRDQFAEGGWYEAFNEFVTDLSTYPTAFVKGPVVRKQTALGWEKDATGKTTVSVVQKLAPNYERVDPFRIYPEPGISNLNQGYVFEHQPMTHTDLADLIGVPGYNEDAIRLVLKEGPRASWFFSVNEMEKNEQENKTQAWNRPTEMFDVLEFWGKVSGQMLLDWGMSAKQIPDNAQTYNVCIHTVGNYVIKAMLNYDPLGNKPYKHTSMFKVPGALWGRAVPEVIEDIQNVCNAAARSLVNNMGIASGPQVEVDISRIAPGEDLTQMFPWKIWQTVPQKDGQSGQAIHFTQPESNASELMAIYEKFARLADEHSGIPSYVSGDISVTGAGRTSSGLSMLMGAAGKSIRQVVSYIDNDIVKPVVMQQFIYNMRYDPDESIKGDAFVVPRGAVNLAMKETAEVRRIEFLNATANPIDFGIMGPEGRGAVLREVSKSLQMPQEEIVPERKKLALLAASGAFKQGGQGGGSQPPAPDGAALLPDGSPPGGASAALARNQNTGAAA